MTSLKVISDHLTKVIRLYLFLRAFYRLTVYGLKPQVIYMNRLQIRKNFLSKNNARLEIVRK